MSFITVPFGYLLEFLYRFAGDYGLALLLFSVVAAIPVYTDGVYFKKKRARVIIGKPVYVSELYNNQDDYKTNVENITKVLRNNIINLGNTLAERVDYENKKKNK